MIIVEGADRVGKSTLCGVLHQRILGSAIVPFGLLPDDWDFYFSYLPKMGYWNIWDRGHWSEVAYQQATSRPKRVDEEELRLVDAECFRWGCVYVVLTCERWLLEERLRERPDDKFDAQVVQRANLYFMNHYLGPSDIEITCSAGRPWPQPRDVDYIVSLHNKRVNTMRSMRARIEAQTHASRLS